MLVATLRGWRLPTLIGREPLNPTIPSSAIMTPVAGSASGAGSHCTLYAWSKCTGSHQHIHPSHALLAGTAVRSGRCVHLDLVPLLPCSFCIPGRSPIRSSPRSVSALMRCRPVHARHRWRGALHAVRRRRPAQRQPCAPRRSRTHEPSHARWPCDCAIRAVFDSIPSPA